MQRRPGTKCTAEEAKELAEQMELERQITERAQKRWQLTRERLIVDKKGSYTLVTVHLEKSGSGKVADFSDDFGLLGKVKKMGSDGPGLIVIDELDKALIGMYNEKLPKESSKRIRMYSVVTDVNGRTTAESMLSELLAATKVSVKFLVPTPKSLEDAYFLSRSSRAQGTTEEATARAMAKRINDGNIDEHVKDVLTRAATSLSMKRRSSISSGMDRTGAETAGAADGTTESTPEENEAAATEDEDQDDDEAKARSELSLLMANPSNALLLQEMFATSAASKFRSGSSTIASLIGDFQTRAVKQQKDSKSDDGFFSSFYCWRS